MSSSSLLHRRLLDAQKNMSSSSEYLEAFKEYQFKNCYDPQRVQVYDAHTQTSRMMSVPCGRCYHCVETKINSWVTRMYAHLEDFKNVYFVTLTYRSISNKDVSVNKLILDKLKDALWHYDSLNVTSKAAYHPCVLCKSHYQNFLKRLRKNTGLTDLTYVLSGEYGKQYGRPHFHMILFTNGFLTHEDLVRAWSVAIFKKDNGEYVLRRNHKRGGIPYNFPIGHVDFHNLLTNGSLNTAAKIRVDGNYLNVANCFSYVCKYVVKGGNINFNRVRLAHSALYHKQTYVKVFEGEQQWNIIRRYLSNAGYEHKLLESHIKTLKKYTYEKNVFSPEPSLYSDGLCTTKKVVVLGFETELSVLPELYQDFRNSFSAFVEFSRGCPIGSVYANRHLSEFTQGVFNRPLLQSSGFVVPSYFRRKASNELYGLRQCSKTLKSTSYVLGGLKDLYRRFSLACETGVPPREHILTEDGLYTPETYLHDDQYTDEELRQGRAPILSALRHPDHHFADLSSQTKIVLCNYRAQYWRFDKHSRSYRMLYDEDMWLFLERWLVLIYEEFVRHDHLLAIQKQNEEHLNASLDLLLSKLPPPDGARRSIDHIRKTIIDALSHERAERQKLYDELHANCE